ncbi:hypothetical protein NDU88_007895 [Pleurodeles waltl]|uniref:Uncharacterized protein n=1 Tax=Pleurodeles waltl TaxID=8319 RepID=A0AAV7U2W1_PLEWA|nr:hypothetical protein NDU88_007895 [Pleurodeles waltl]
MSDRSHDWQKNPKNRSAQKTQMQDHPDYGLAPRFPRMRNRTTRKAAAGLAQVGKSKRDEADLDEYYYDDLL